MTKENAIEIILYNLLDRGGCDSFDKKDKEALLMAVEALEQQTAEDCVSRRSIYELLDSIDHVPQWVIDKFTELPSVTPKQKVGRWHTIQLHNIEDSIEIEEWQECSCSSCGRLHITPHNSWDYSFQFFGYCPYCGAKMEVRK